MDTKKVSPTESIFTFHNSTATIGRLLQNELLQDPNVIFAGYSCPHPLETKMIVKLITSGKNPREVITNTYNSLISKLDELHSAVETFKDSEQ
jgi:DNA-directed RNA polymerase subunit L